MKQPLLTFLLTALMLALATVVNAADTGKNQGNWKVDRRIDTYDLRPDGTGMQTSEFAATVLTERGITALNQADLNYSSSLEKLTVVEAYTLKKDGRRLDVPAANIQDRDVVDGGGPMYSDFKGKVIIFPNLEVGDKVVYTLRDELKITMFPGQFSLMESFDNQTIVDDREISISTPLNGLALQTWARGVDGGRQADSNGQAHWHWQWHNATLPDSDDYTPADEAPTLLVTSFKDFASLASAYQQRAEPRAAVTTKTRALADQLTHGVSDPREQARILYTWVARNIRYAGNCIGTGSVVPHDADVILDNRLGDCKDHTALLQSLLAAKGIASTPVLVNSGARYELPALPVPEYFNHVINYIPSLNVYADSTSDFIPFGSLPYYESGKPVLPTQGFTAPVQTPLVRWDDYTSRLTVHATVMPDGSLDGDVQDSDSPLSATSRREYFAGLNPDSAKDYVHNMFARYGTVATGKLSYDDPRAGTNPYTYGIQYEARDVLNIPGAGAFAFSSVYRSAGSISDWVTPAAAKPIRHNYRCTGTKIIEDYRYDIPRGMNILWMPKDAHAAAENLSYDATYKREGQALIAHRQFEYRITPHMCTPAEYEALRPIAVVIAKDLRSQILYQMD